MSTLRHCRICRGRIRAHTTWTCRPCTVTIARIHELHRDSEDNGNNALRPPDIGERIERLAARASAELPLFPCPRSPVPLATRPVVYKVHCAA